MYPLTGEYDCKIDAKGRIRLPSALLRQFGDQDTYGFVINRGFENHLMLYPKDVWTEKTKEINQLNIYINKNRQVVRYFYRGATQVATDASDRILVPKSLVEYAGIEKEVVLFAYMNFVEIWSKDNYEQIISMEPNNFAGMAEEVFGGGQQGSDNE